MKVVFWTVVCLLAAWFLFVRLPINGWHVNIGEGTQVGYVSAVETSGIIWKTGTAYIKPTLESTQEDVYCVSDKTLLAQLGEASKANQKIEVKNVDYLVFGAKNCDAEPAMITSFEVIK